LVATPLLLSLQQVDKIIYDDWKHNFLNVVVFFSGLQKQLHLIKSITFETNGVSFFKAIKQM
jgi:hypothetical protein